MRRASLAQQHLSLDIPEADVQAVNRPNDAVSRRHHQNHEQHEFCLSFAAASTDPADSTCVASITLASLKADRSTCKAAPKQAANQVASQSTIKMRRQARFWSRNDGNNHRVTGYHRGVIIGHRGSHLDSRKLSRSSPSCLRLSSTPPPPRIGPSRHPRHTIFLPYLTFRWPDGS